MMNNPLLIEDPQTKEKRLNLFVITLLTLIGILTIDALAKIIKKKYNSPKPVSTSEEATDLHSAKDTSENELAEIDVIDVITTKLISSPPSSSPIEESKFEEEADLLSATQTTQDVISHEITSADKSSPTNTLSKPESEFTGFQAGFLNHKRGLFAQVESKPETMPKPITSGFTPGFLNHSEGLFSDSKKKPSQATKHRRKTSSVGVQLTS